MTTTSSAAPAPIRGGRTQHDPTPIKEQTMTDRPYTDTDLRTEAGLALDALVHLPTVEEIVTSLRQSYVPHLHADGDLVTWGGLLDDGELTEAARQIHERMIPAAPVGVWAINLGADGLEPGEQQLTLGAGEPRVRIHFAFAPDMSEGDRRDFVAQIAEATITAT
jgi:hypothetical protein